MLLSLDEACFPPDIAYDSHDLRHMMSRSGAQTLVLEEGGEIRAFLLLDVDRNNMATLVTLDVHGEHRRKGYASTLLARSEQILFEQGVAIYSLQVDTRTKVRFPSTAKTVSKWNDCFGTIIQEAGTPGRWSKNF